MTKLKTLILIMTHLCEHFVLIICNRKALFSENGDFLPHVRLAKDLTDAKRYDNRVRPVMNHSLPTRVLFSMSLYQILSINEKMQSIDLNVWVIQKWRDEFLGWNPNKYGLINYTILPYTHVWLPDTYLYNSVVMNREETERYINVVVNTEYWHRQRGAQIKFMYPALYRTSCRIHIRYFPYDQQNCTLLISSWTSDKSSIDFVPEFESVNLDNFILNEEWVIISFEIRRIEEKFVCCSMPWALLEASLVIRRKPLYYIVNLVIPTSVITLVAVTGFFTPASTSNERREKLSLGIDSLLAMSILMMMVSEQMPTTSDYVPLFGLFYLSIIFIIFIGTLFTAFILNVHLRKMQNKPIPPLIAYIFFYKVAPFLSVQPSATLLKLWTETGVQIHDFISSKTKQKHFKLFKTGIVSQLSFNDNDKIISDSTNPIYAYKKQNEIKLVKSLNADANGVNEKKVLDALKSKFSTTVESQAIFNLYSNKSSSAAARDNWRRMAQRASTKRQADLCCQLQTSVKSTLNDIPYVDVLPGCVQSSSINDDSGSIMCAQRLPSLSPLGKTVQSNALLSSLTIPHCGISHDGPNALFDPYSTLSVNNTSVISAAVTPGSANYSASPEFGYFFSTTMPKLCIPNATNIRTGSIQTATMFDLKLRRRYSHEWEYLATVLDRVLLIIFSWLVALVTALMLIAGEVLHWSYDLKLVKGGTNKSLSSLNITNFKK